MYFATRRPYYFLQRTDHRVTKQLPWKWFIIWEKNKIKKMHNIMLLLLLRRSGNIFYVKQSWLILPYSNTNQLKILDQEKLSWLSKKNVNYSIADVSEREKLIMPIGCRFTNNCWNNRLKECLRQKAKHTITNVIKALIQQQNKEEFKVPNTPKLCMLVTLFRSVEHWTISMNS